MYKKSKMTYIIVESIAIGDAKVIDKDTVLSFSHGVTSQDRSR
jgi:hypothetical protein